LPELSTRYELPDAVVLTFMSLAPCYLSYRILHQVQMKIHPQFLSRAGTLFVVWLYPNGNTPE